MGTATVHVRYTWDDKDVKAELDNISLESLGERKIRNAIRVEMKKARDQVVQKSKRALPNDPRNSYLSVKKIVYRKILGANISLYDKRASHMAISGSKSTGGRSGIRRKRSISKRTKQINGYTGYNRAFILRWVETGTSGRFTKTLKYQAYRGVIRPRPFFKSASRAALEEASVRLNARLDKMIIRAAKARSKAPKG